MLTMTATYREADDQVTRETIKAEIYDEAWARAQAGRSDTRTLLHVMVDR